MLSIKLILDKGDINRRAQRVVVVGLPSLLLVVSQGVVAPDIFMSMVTVTALIAAFTPLARGGFFHNFKFSVLNDEKIAVSKAAFMLVTVFAASQFFTAALYHSGDLSDQRLAVWFFYTIVSFVAFLFGAMVEMYFYDYRHNKVSWLVVLLMIGVAIVIFMGMMNLPVLWGQFSRIASQISVIAVLSFFIAQTLQGRFSLGAGWSVIKESHFWIGINVALVVSLLAYLARTEVLSGGFEHQDILLANCLLVFGFLKLLLYKEIRSLEQHYLKESPAIIIELLAVIVLAAVVLVASEFLTFFFATSSNVTIIEPEWHMRAYFSVVSLSLAMLIGGKVLRLFEGGKVKAILLTAVVFLGWGLSTFFPAWSFAVMVAVYVLSHVLLLNLSGTRMD